MGISGNTDEVSSVKQTNCKMYFCWQFINCAYICYINIMYFKTLDGCRTISKSHYLHWIHQKFLYLALFRLLMWNNRIYHIYHCENISISVFDSCKVHLYQNYKNPRLKMLAIVYNLINYNNLVINYSNRRLFA